MTKRALLVGVNQYLIPGTDLRGCVNDVINLKALLTQHFGFKAKDITTLTDKQATTKAMQTAIKALIASGVKGDSLLFHFSGHGSNVPDKNGDEADKRDEILCPHDLDWNKPLTDDWLRQAFDKVKAGVNFTVILDCCHSGTATRAPQPPDAPSIPRYLPCPLDLWAAESGRKLKGKVAVGMRAASPAARKKSDVVVVDIPEVLITGCRDTQTSADAFIGGSFNGALTYYLVETLKAIGPDSTFRAVHTEVLKLLKKNQFDQVPQLEGRKAGLDSSLAAVL